MGGGYASLEGVFLYLQAAPLLESVGIILFSPAVKPRILSDACIRVRIKYFYSFMTFGPY